MSFPGFRHFKVVWMLDVMDGWWLVRRKNLDNPDICTQPLSIICYRGAWHSGDHNGIIITAPGIQTWDAISESRATASNKQLPLHCGYINYIMWKSSVRSWSPTPLYTHYVQCIVTLPEYLNSVACCILISECIDWLYLGWWLGNNKPKTKIHCICILVSSSTNLTMIAIVW